MWPHWCLVEAITADVGNQEQVEQPTYALTLGLYSTSLIAPTIGTQ